MNDKSPNENFKLFLEDFVKKSPTERNTENELEIRFGTNKHNRITRIDFNNVIEKLKSSGFTNIEGQSNYHLNINCENINPKTGQKHMGNLRTQVKGLSLIQNYCKTNSLLNNKNELSSKLNVHFIQKRNKKITDEMNSRIDFFNFQFRVNYKTETNLQESHGAVRSTMDSWKDSRKIFRYIKRFTFIHADRNEYPFKLDLSVVKTSTKNEFKHYLEPSYTIKDSNVFNNAETYEIELELDRGKCLLEPNLDILFKKIKKGILLVLSGLQQTNYPISYIEQQQLLKEYQYLVHYNDTSHKKWLTNRDFIGYSSISLEMKNIQDIDIDSSEANINNQYTVTDKADGIRKLLFISKNGKIYFIDINMKIQFTGYITKHKKNFNTILDGEHVLHDKNGRYINLYLCFDIYIKNKNDVRPFPFIKTEKINYSSRSIEKNKFRTEELNDYLNHLDMVPLISSSNNNFTIRSKIFYNNSFSKNIFEQCKRILDNINDGLYEYETDGLIFTPSDKSVGANNITLDVPFYKTTWKHSLKWKPSEFNTIDFLVTTKKNDNGEDFIGNIYQDGLNMNSNKQITQYKTLILRIGYDPKKHGYLNPCNDIIQNNLPKSYNSYDRNIYKPMPFEPHDPTPTFPIYLCNILIEEMNDSKYMFIEDKQETFGDETIVEFKFDQTAEKYWQWVPIRVRHDKTSDYKAGNKNYGNAFHVAQSVWRSINNPITSEMIESGLGIPSINNDDNVYYNRKTTESYTQSLRDFHNKYIKKKLIKNFTVRGNNLIDMTVGKAGDLFKWIEAKLNFVLGIDESEDNIYNRKDGACKRYLDICKKYKTLPKALFLRGDSSLNIKEGKAFYSEKNKQIIQALLGEGPKDEKFLGTGVYNQYGVAKNGFDIVSNQFSIHYFFKNQDTFYNFLRNVSDFCKVGGYFIGTCYDGEKVFRLLQNKKYNESDFILKHKKKIWECKKLYTSEEFKNDESSLGYEIDVYQETINKFFKEYLVNFNFLTNELEHYGFIPVKPIELKTTELTSAIGSFSELFDTMVDEDKSQRLRKSNYGQALKLSSEEKRISFLNNYFIYKKVRNPDAKAITLSKINRSKQHIDGDDSYVDDLKTDILTIKRDIIKIPNMKITLPNKL